MTRDIFISYSGKDKPIADAVCHGLEEAGIRCWIAPRDARVGLSWKQSIVEAIQGSKAMVLIFSKQANESSQVRREVDIAFESGRLIVPFRIEDVEMNSDIYYCIASSHWLDALSDPRDEKINQLVTSVKGILQTYFRQDAEARRGESGRFSPVESVAANAESPPALPVPLLSAVSMPQASAPTPPAFPEVSRPGIRKPAVSGSGKNRRLVIGASILMGMVAILAMAALWFGIAKSGGEKRMEQASALIEKKDYSSALPLLLKGVEADDPQAQYLLARLFYYGWGVSRDYDLSFKHARASAEQDHPGGMNMLGLLYEFGHGTKKDIARAHELIRRSADRDFPQGIANLGRHYLNGIGVEKDEKKAFSLLTKASDMGYALAQYYLGWCYESGLGTAKNMQQAVKWYEKSASQNVVEAQATLGGVYLNGRDDVKKDHVQAQKWLRLAAEQGDAAAQTNLGWLSGESDEIAPDYGEQLKWYALAAEQGNKISIDNLKLLNEREWPVTALIPGGWKSLNAEERAAEISRFEGESVSRKLRDAGWRIERIRTLPPSFYKGADLYELELRKGRKDLGVYNYIRFPGRENLAFQGIEGTSPSIHKMNQAAPLKIDTVHQALDYTRFFCGVIQSDGGRFRIIEQWQDILWKTPPTDAKSREGLEKQIQLFNLQRKADGKGWSGKGTIAYSNTVFLTNLEVELSGMVSMTDDKAISDSLKIRLERFDGNGVRVTEEPP